MNCDFQNEFMDKPCNKLLTKDYECLDHGTREQPFVEEEWDRSEDSYLIEMFMDGIHPSVIAEKFGRKQSAIIKQLVSLGFIRMGK